MPGDIRSDKKVDTDILFDLTIADDQELSESELLSLVNYGQVSESIKVCGADGATHSIIMALLWDEDYIDILKKTSKYANDPTLRARLVRRLRLHKAIQKIDCYEYDNDQDPKSQRQLWHILCRMADAQIEYLDGKYGELEAKRNTDIISDIRAIDDTLKETAPESIKKFIHSDNRKSKESNQYQDTEKSTEKLVGNDSTVSVDEDLKNRQEHQDKELSELTKEMGAELFGSESPAVRSSKNKKRDDNVQSN